ncbi:MAG: NAD(P)H-dependent oxidoreductase [Candidatus Sericytochromatia bacterium]|nr:NAD(P)H-dependent oxidoreductase [Candidatus Sericytochromatia bacterium]
MVRVVGLGGALGDASVTGAAMRRVLAEAESAGAEVVQLDLNELVLPMFDARHREGGPAVERLLTEVRAADAMVWCSPLYHGTVSGTFKNALDWLELLARDERPYLTDKPIGLVAAAGGTQGMQAINTMEYAVRALRGLTVPYVVAISRAWQAFDAEGQPHDEALAGQLAILGREVVRLGQWMKAARSPSTLGVS